MFHRASKWLLDHVQKAISTPLFFVGTIVLTLSWMGYNAISLLIHGEAIDPPTGFFPLTVLIYTLVSLWVENAMKVQYAEQQRLGQIQLDKIEMLSVSLLDGQKLTLNVVNSIQEIVNSNLERDQIIQQLISVVDMTVDTVEKNTEQILELTRGHDAAHDNGHS